MPWVSNPPRRNPKDYSKHSCIKIKKVKNTILYLQSLAEVPASGTGPAQLRKPVRNSDGRSLKAASKNPRPTHQNHHETSRLQPKSDGLHPSSDGLQPKSDGLQPSSVFRGMVRMCVHVCGCICGCVCLTEPNS